MRGTLADITEKAAHIQKTALILVGDFLRESDKRSKLYDPGVRPRLSGGRNAMNIRAIAFTEKGQSWKESLGFPVERGVPVMQWAREPSPMRTRCCSSAHAALRCVRLRRSAG